MTQSKTGFPPLVTVPALVEAVKAWLIQNSWAQQDGAEVVSTSPDASSAVPTAMVLCQLIQVSHCWGLRLAAASLPTGNAGHAIHEKSAISTVAPDRGRTYEEAEQRFLRRLCSCTRTVRELYNRTFGTSPSVSTVASGDGVKDGHHQQQQHPQRPSPDSVDGLDAGDVFWALALYVSSALCWRRRWEQQQRLAAAGAYAAGVVSASRDASEDQPRRCHDRGAQYRSDSAAASSRRQSTPSTGGYTDRVSQESVREEHTRDVGGDHFAQELRERYGLADGGSDPLKGDVRISGTGPRCQMVLRRLLPFLEHRLSMSQLWRQPPLLAAIDTLAQEVCRAQDCAHALNVPMMGGAAPSGAAPPICCPLCFAAALNNDLAVEALSQLRGYAVLYHHHYDDEDGRSDFHGQHPENGCWNTCMAGWVAACRVALWNSCEASLTQLCRPSACAAAWAMPQQQQQPPAKLGSLTIGGNAHDTCGRQMACLRALWWSWWAAEVRLAAPAWKRCSTARTTNAVARDAAARWRTSLLFLQRVLPALAAALGIGDVSWSPRMQGEKVKRPKPCRDAERELLAYLVGLPFARLSSPPTALQPHLATTAQHHGDSAGIGAIHSSAGTVFHWLCQQGDIAVLTLFLHTLSGNAEESVCGLSASPGDLGVTAKTEASGKVDVDASSTNPARASSTRPLCVALGPTAMEGKNAPAFTRAEASGVLPARPPAIFGQRAVSVSSVWALHVKDALGVAALEVACQHGHLPCVRLLLQAGMSANECSRMWETFGPALPLPFLHLLFDPSLLEGAASPPRSMAERLRRSDCPPATASATLAQLAYRLWREKVRHLPCAPPLTTESTFQWRRWHTAYAQCVAAQDRVLRPAIAALEFDAYEPTARLVVLSVVTRRLMDWLTTASPRVRSGEGPMDFTEEVSGVGHDCEDANGCNSSPRWKATSPLPSPSQLHRLRLQHTVALRLYTQLTCPLGRGLLRRAVKARCAACAALEDRERRAVTTPHPGCATDDVDAVSLEAEEGCPAAAGIDVDPSKSSAMTTSSEAGKARLDLQKLYTEVLDEVRKVDLLLATEQRRIAVKGQFAEERRGQQRMPSVEPRHGAAVCSSPFTGPEGVATVARHSHHSRRPSGPSPTDRVVERGGVGTDEEGDDDGGTPALYVLSVLPSADALRRARWGSTPAESTSITAYPKRQRLWSPHLNGEAERVEPTMWMPAQAARQVWLRLPDGLDLNRLLRENGGGGFGVVAGDMPLVSPLQRGDLVTFLHNSQDGAGGPDPTTPTPQRCPAPPQFVVQRIFSEPRTLPYLNNTCETAAHAAATAPVIGRTETPPLPEHLATPLPISVTFPFAAVSDGVAVATAIGKHDVPTQRRFITDGDSDGEAPERRITLMARCLPAPYTARTQVPRGTRWHPLDWLQMRLPTSGPHAATGASACLRCPRHATQEGSDRPTVATDVLSAFLVSPHWVSRWSRLVWADQQPCWLQECSRTTPGKGSGSAGQSMGAPTTGRLLDDGSGSASAAMMGSSCELACLRDPFSTWDDDRDVMVARGEETDAGRSALIVQCDLKVVLATASPDAATVATRWTTRVDAGAVADDGDAVVGCVI